MSQVTKSNISINVQYSRANEVNRNMRKVIILFVLYELIIVNVLLFFNENLGGVHISYFL